MYMYMYSSFFFQTDSVHNDGERHIPYITIFPNSTIGKMYAWAGTQQDNGMIIEQLRCGCESLPLSPQVTASLTVVLLTYIHTYVRTVCMYVCTCIRVHGSDLYIGMGLVKKQVACTYVSHESKKRFKTNKKDVHLHIHAHTLQLYCYLL